MTINLIKTSSIFDVMRVSQPRISDLLCGKINLFTIEYLCKLESRDLTINDANLAMSQLSAISYYRLSAYSYPYRVRDLRSINLSFVFHKILFFFYN